MDNVWVKGDRVPVIDTSHLSPERNQQLESAMGSSDQKVELRKSELVEIPTNTARVIYRIKGLWPLDFFQDELIIDELKVSIMYKGLISRQLNSILIKDITDILFYSSLIFGSLKIFGGDFKGDKGPLSMRLLRVWDAKMARRIIMGLMIFSDQKVDTTKMTIQEINQKVYDLGKDK